MSSASVTKQTRTFRIYLDGVDKMPERLKISEYSLIEADARAVLDAMKKPVPKNVLGRSEKMHPGIEYIVTYWHLFNFAYLCHTDDVPAEILHQVIWILEWNVRAVAEAHDEQLRLIGHLMPDQYGDEAKFAKCFMTLNSCRKLSSHNLKPEIDRPAEALRHLRVAIQADREQAARNGRTPDTWQGNPGLHAEYVVALARSRVDDSKAKVELSRIVNEPLKNSGRTVAVVVSKLYLARVLRRLGETKEAEKFESWLVTWLRKNPMAITGQTLRTLFSTDCDPSTDPVFTRLGGDEWLNSRSTTFKTAQRLTRTCRRCSASEPSISVFQCSGCKYTFYCSPECQRAHWPYHKQMCKERAESLKAAAEQRKVDPKGAQRRKDWVKWHDSNHPAHSVGPIHALGLKRDPNRATTHIFVKMVEHVPDAADLLDRFVVVQAGVFKITDVQSEIEVMMGLRKGKLGEFMAEMSGEYAARPEQNKTALGFFNLMFSLQPDVDPSMVYVGMPKIHVAHEAYNPDWRAMMNKNGNPPGPLAWALALGKKDAEHVF